jgi:hypothetical protein
MVLIRRIQVDTFLKELGDDTKGMSKPVMVIGEDAETYILKNQNIYNDDKQSWEVWDSMFVQEVLVYNIAKYLDIKVPECVVADVDIAFLNNAPSLKFNHHYSEGPHFASLFIDGVENNILSGYQQLIAMKKPYIKRSWTSFFKKINNTGDVPKIVAMDLLTGNFDRFSNDGNLIIATQSGQRNIYAIDHGHCFFNPNWDLSKRNLLIHGPSQPTFINDIINQYFRLNGGSPFVGMGIIFRALDQHINVTDPDNHSFQDVVYKIECITPPIINGWFDGIPDEWFVDKATQISSYKQYIMKHKDNIRTLISELFRLNAFQESTGGELNWLNKRTGTQ